MHADVSMHTYMLVPAALLLRNELRNEQIEMYGWVGGRFDRGFWWKGGGLSEREIRYGGG